MKAARDSFSSSYLFCFLLTSKSFEASWRLQTKKVSFRFHTRSKRALGRSFVQI